MAQCVSSIFGGYGMRVNPPRLRQLGHDVQDDAGDVRTLLATTGGRLTLTGTATGPWKVTGAAAAVTKAWRAEIGGAADRLQQAGELFVRAADDYVATDERNAARIGRRRDFE